MYNAALFSDRQESNMAASKTRKKAVSRKATPRSKTTGKKRKVIKKKISAKKASKKKASKKKAVARKKPAAKKKVAKKKVAKKKVAKKASKKKVASKKAASRKKVAKKKPAAKKASKKRATSSKRGAKKPVSKEKTARKTPVKKVAVKKKATARRATPARKRGDLLSGPIHGVAPYKSRRGESYMGKKQLGHFKEILSAWKNELMNEVDRTVHHMQDEAANFPDPNDRATQESEFGLELRTRDRERKLLRKITSALMRIDEGNYGYCEETGEEIGLKRLEARPVATLCVESQERRELAERQFRDRDDRYR
jgi:DnaK suppressor protein